MEVVAIESGTSLGAALDIINAAGHSRIPVYQDDLDHVFGFLYAKDLLRCFQHDQHDVPITTLLRPAYFVPVSKKVNALLREMQKQHVHVAIVVDEYGGTAGLVTIEDIIEEIVGEIQDEYDVEEDTLAQPIGQGAYLLSARYDLYSLSKLLDADFPDEDADTLAGLIYSVLGSVPEIGEVVEVGEWRFTVLSLDGRRIDQVRAEPVKHRTGGEGGPPAAQDATPVSNQIPHCATLHRSEPRPANREDVQWNPKNWYTALKRRDCARMRPIAITGSVRLCWPRTAAPSSKAAM
jgi:CBS domain containing-hemolysin-like protein